jgi:hypothetical protein
MRQIVPIITLLFVLVVSCSTPQPQQVIPGRWAVTEARTTIPGVDPRILKEADFKELNTTYEFSETGGVQISGPEIIGSYTGKWLYSPIDSTISLTYLVENDTLEYPLKLIAWSKHTLELIQSYSGEGQTNLSLARVR